MDQPDRRGPVASSPLVQTRQRCSEKSAPAPSSGSALRTSVAKDFFRRQSPHRRHHPASRCSQASAVEIPKDDSNIIQHPTVVVYFGAENIGRLENRKNLASHAFAVAEIVKSRG